MDSGLASCQGTQLHQITHKRNRLNVGQYVDEVNLNRVSVTALATSFCGGMLGRIAGSNQSVVGTQKRTPVSDLKLSVGDVVTVKSRSDIIKTLDANGKNRGLWFDPVMLRYCGQTLKVTKRITTLVDESSGKIRQLKISSVVLEDLQCDPRWLDSLEFRPPRSNVLRLGSTPLHLYAPWVLEVRQWHQIGSLVLSFVANRLT